MKIKVSELSSLIREIVRDEIKKSLPAMVSEHLTEMYLRKIVTEGRRARSVSEELGETEEEVPRPLANDNKGIYHKSSLMKDDDDEQPRRTNEVVSKLLARDNPLKFIYEGVDEIPKNPIAGSPTGKGIPIEKLGMDFDRMNELVKGMESRSADRQSISMPAAATRPFDPRLDQPVGGVTVHSPSVPRQRSVSQNPFLNESAAFPDKPIILDE